MSGVLGGLIASLKPVIRTNLFKDASFTTLSSGKWYSSYGGQSSDTYKTGPYSYFAGYDPNGDIPGDIAYNETGVLQGKTYSLSFWVNCNTGFSGTLQGGFGYRPFSGSGNGTWQLFKFENLSGSVGDLYFSIASWGALYIDDVWLVEGPTAYNPVT
jgi:hypothetical protein